MDRQKETEEVLALLEAAGGPDLASHWAWEMTPMPCGLPSDKQLAQGRELAKMSAEAREDERLKLRQQIDADMAEALAKATKP